MKTFQLICLKCGSQDVGIRISLDDAGTTYECGGCGNAENGNDDDLMSVKTNILPGNSSVSHQIANALLSAHKNIAAGSGPVIGGEVQCTCTQCTLARAVLGA